ncbi:MAG TPA: hypothetical protein PLI90_04835 [Rhodocyclaceae bacterium]|nr:hypothetical protein [Rhodocyclaceae bacterium]
MYYTHTLGPATLQLFEQIKSHVSISDFCATAATVEFAANDGLLENDLTLFRLSFPGFELEARCREGIVFIRRNGQYQHSEQILGGDRLHVAIQWDVESIGCGIAPWTGDWSVMNSHMRAVRTPYTVPPLELHRSLRAHNLLVGTAYKSADDVFATVLDCLHLCEEDIRKFGAERFVWGKQGADDRPLDEPEISRLVASFLASYGAARNFDVSCEPVSGGGNVDFWVVAPVSNAGLAKIAIEAKKADSPNLSHGFTAQLPAYMTRLKAQHGIYLVYWLKSPNYPHPSHDSFQKLEIEVLHQLRRAPGIRSVGIDLSRTASPSRT